MMTDMGTLTLTCMSVDVTILILAGLVMAVRSLRKGGREET